MNNLISEKVINTLDAFQLNVREIVEGFMIGLHKSPYHGFSVEFADYRQYIPGDQIKDIDWKLYAKSDRYYVRRYEDETNVSAYIILDHSSSMIFKSADMTKIEYAKTLAASLTYLIHKQNDAVGLVTYNNDITYWQPPKTNQTFVSGIYKKLFDLKCNEDTDSLNALHSIAEKIKKRSLIIIISDYLDNLDNIVKCLKHFRYQKHDIIVFNIRDERETNFSYNKETIFIDSETKEELRVFPWQVRENYIDRYSAFYEELKSQCLQFKIDFYSMTTSTKIEDNLLRYLIKRRSLS